MLLSKEIEDMVKVKVCTKCKREMALDMFSKRNSKNGLSSWCKKCNNENAKKYHEGNKEKIAKLQKKYYEENKDKIGIVTKKYREQNKEKISIKRERYKEKHKDVKKKYKIENRDKFSIWSQKRRAKKLLLPHTFTLEQWVQCKNYFSNRCCYCGQEVELTMEHLVPVAKGGGYSQQNIVPACGSCNSSKGTKPFH